MATRELAGALQDVRKMRRSLRLREEQDPELVAETLTKILKEAIAVRSASGGRLGKGAVNELRNIRRDISAGQIDAGQRTGEFVGKYSAILDQIQNVEQESREEAKQQTEGEGSGIGQSIAQNLPSADMITSALITANPILGYTTKIAKDLFRSSTKRRKNQREAERKRLELLNKEEEKLEEEAKDASGDSPQDQELLSRLEMIREEIHELNRVLTGSDDKLERIVEETNETNRLERQQDSTSDLMRSESEFERSMFGAGTATADEAEEQFENMFDLDQGMLAGFGGAIGGMAGSLASKLLAPFVGLMGFIKQGGSILGRLGRASGLIAAAFAVYDFVDGFMNTSDILDKEESKVSITDRIRVGSASLISGLLSPVDWILDFMDMGFMEDKDSFTKKIANSESELIQFFLSPGSWIIDYVRDFDWSETMDKIKDSIGGAIESVGNKFSEIGKAIEDWIDEKIEWFNETWIGQQIQELSDALSMETSTSRAVNRMGGYYRGMGPDVEELDRRMSETPVITSDAISSALSIVDREINSRDQRSSTVIAPNTSNNTTINNNSFQGSSGPKDEDRTWRRFGTSGGFMGW